MNNIIAEITVFFNNELLFSLIKFQKSAQIVLTNSRKINKKFKYRAKIRNWEIILPFLKIVVICAASAKGAQQRWFWVMMKVHDTLILEQMDTARRVREWFGAAFPSDTRIAKLRCAFPEPWRRAIDLEP